MQRVELYRDNIFVREFIGPISCYTDLRHFTLMMCLAYEDPYSIHNVLPRYSLKRNVEHHPIRILKSLGYTVKVTY